MNDIREQPGNAGRNSKAMAMLAILLVALGVYSNSLLNGFVYDDNFQVLDNPWIRDTSHVGDLLTTNVWRFGGSVSNYYRPMMSLTNMFNYQVFGPQPWGFHLTNVVLHGGASLLVFLIALRLFEKRSSGSSLIPALVAAMVFATHPIHTEAVNWIGGLPDLGFTLFYLSSLLLYMKSTCQGRVSSRGMHALSGASFFLSALFKEPALTLPAVLLAYDLAYLGPSCFGRIGELAKRHAPYALAALLYFSLRLNALEGFAPVRDPEGVTSLQSVLSAFPLLLKYLGKLVVPVNLNAYHDFRPVTSLLAARSLLSIAATLGLMACALLVTLRGKHRPVFFYLALTVLPLLPALYIQVIPGSKFGERYLYLPVFGYSMLVALVLKQLGSAGRRGAASALVVASLLVGLYSVSTFQRNRVWKDDRSLWADTLKKSPDSANVHNNLGAAYGRMGLTDEAIEHYRNALKLKPDQPDLHDNLGTAYQEKGWQDGALEHFQIAVSLNPRHVGANAHLGDVYRRSGLADKAIEHYRVALQSRPDVASFHGKLGLSYGQKGRFEEAAAELLLAVQLEPDDVMARNNLGVVFAKLGRMDEAIEQFQYVLDVLPDSVETLFNVSRAYQVKGMEKEAARYLRKAGELQETGFPGRVPDVVQPR